MSLPSSIKYRSGQIPAQYILMLPNDGKNETKQNKKTLKFA